MHRGEVWWARLPEPAGRRPVVLLSRNAAYEVRTSVTIAPVTRTVRHLRTEVALGPADGMPAACVVNLDDIETIRKTALIERITVLSPEKMAQVARAVVFALDLKN
ncbi:MAG: type II toxin-antitoxin system PemK/MazF family toxin [Chloroflexi bacterium]|nr:type II toxin-antitoxin system PemK/MazF family toxin [Chloroflexota bacterium]